MESFNTNQKLRDTLFRQLNHLVGSRPPTADDALVKPWHSANMEEKFVTLQCLMQYDVSHFNTEHFLELLIPVSVRRTYPADPRLKELHTSILHLHSALLVRVMQKFSDDRY